MNGVLKAFAKEQKASQKNDVQEMSGQNWAQTATEHSQDNISKKVTLQDALNVKTHNYRGDYDPYKIPPDFELAKSHAKASSVNCLADRLQDDEIENEEAYCPCWNLPFDSDQFPLWVSPLKLGELGSGFTLFYDLLKWLVLWFFICTLFTGYHFYDNYTAGNEGDWNSDAEDYYYLGMSMAAHGHDEPNIWQVWLNTILVFVLLWIIFPILQIRHKKLCKVIDEKTITPSDFTLQFSGLPNDLDLKDFQKFLEENSRKDKTTTVAKINMAYDIDSYVHKQRKYEYWRQKRENAQDTSTCCGTSKADCEAKLTKIAQQLETLQGAVTEQKKFLGIVFVTYNTEIEAKQSRMYLGKKYFEQWWHVITNFIFFCRKKSKSKYRNQTFDVRRADEPSGVIWENLGEKGAFKRRFITLILTIILLSGGAGVVYWSSLWRRELRSAEDDASTNSELVFIRILGFVPALLIVVINQILIVAITFFSKLEKYSTQTDYYTSRATKMSIAMFLNTSIVAIIVYQDDLYGSDSLIAEIFGIVITNAIFSPLFQFLNTKFFVIKIRRWLAEKKGEDSKMTQQQANNLFQGLNVDMARRNANIMKTYLLAMFYGPILPIVFPITILSIIAEYWVGKIVLLRRHCRPENLGNDLDVVILRLVKLGVLIFAATSFGFNYDYNEDSFLPGIIGLAIAVVSIFTPFQKLLKAQQVMKKLKVASFKENEEEVVDERTYEDYSVEFFEDYDRENPVTSQQAYEAWIELVGQKSGEQAAQHAKELLGDRVNQPMSQVIKTYAKLPALSSNQAKELLPGFENMIMENMGTEGYARQQQKKKFGSKFVRGVQRKQKKQERQESFVRNTTRTVTKPKNVRRN